jgi:hypothetical protein
MIAAIVIADIKTNNFIEVVEDREQIDRILDTAIDDGVTSLAQVDGNNNLSISKDAAIKSFFLSLYSAFGVLDDKDNQEKLNLYIPVVAVTMEDGYFIFYSDEYLGTDGHPYVSKRWSEKYPYYYEDGDFIYGFTLGDIITLYDKSGILEGSGSPAVYTMDYHDLQTKEEYSAFRKEHPESFLLEDEAYKLVRKSSIINCMEDTITSYTNRHNRIAEEYGITYNFSLPVIRDDEWARFIDDISMFVIFQGYPYGNGTDEVYNRFASAGAKFTKRKGFYIEQKGWYRIYHRSNCPELSDDAIILEDEIYYDAEACVKEGAYACPVCNKTGVYAPEY